MVHTRKSRNEKSQTQQSRSNKGQKKQFQSGLSLASCVYKRNDEPMQKTYSQKVTYKATDTTKLFNLSRTKYDLKKAAFSANVQQILRDG